MGRESLGMGCGVQEGAAMTRYMGSNFDDFLSNDDLLGDCELVAQERVLDHVTSAGFDSKVVETLRQIHHKLLENQGKLDPDTERVLRDNLWDLYDS